MATKARIENGIVCEVMDADPFPPFHAGLLWVDCGPEVEQGWAWDGKTFAPPQDEPIPQDVVRENLSDAIQAHMDAVARSRSYDGILSLCSYATSSHPKFGAEGKAGVKWRDACWDKAYEIFNDCLSRNRPVPSEEELLREMPTMEW